MITYHICSPVRVELASIEHLQDKRGRGGADGHPTKGGYGFTEMKWSTKLELDLKINLILEGVVNTVSKLLGPRLFLANPAETGMAISSFVVVRMLFLS